jgi:hypothetical protein
MRRIEQLKFKPCIYAFPAIRLPADPALQAPLSIMELFNRLVAECPGHHPARKDEYGARLATSDGVVGKEEQETTDDRYLSL